MGEGDRPAVRLAYEFIVPSYEWAINRWDALHSRIDRLLTFSAALAVGAPVLVEALHGEDHNGRGELLVIAWVVFAVIGFLAIWALNHGTLRLLNLNTICTAEWLESGDEEFRGDLLKSAGEDFEANIHDVNAKARIEKAMLIALFLEAGFLAGWIIS